MPPDVPWPKPTIGSRPEIFEYEPNVRVPPVTGVLVVGGDVAAVAVPPVVAADVPPLLLSPHAAAIKPMAAKITATRVLSFMIVPLLESGSRRVTSIAW